LVRAGAMKRVAQLAIYVFERSESALEIIIQCFVVLIAQVFVFASKVGECRFSAHVLLYQGSEKEQGGESLTAIEGDERLRVEAFVLLGDVRGGLHFLELASADQLNLSTLAPDHEDNHP